MKTILQYPGAKNRLASWICTYIPEHQVYLEPYAGSLAVLFAKPRCHIETVNDLNGGVVNFFRVLRDYPEELIRQINLTPYSRQEYLLAFEEVADEIERARRFCVRCWMGYGASNRVQNGFRNGQVKNAPNPAKSWGNLPDALQFATGRLKGVQIEHLPALELIQRYNTKDVLIYADPPYLPETRSCHNLYMKEMTTEDHIELLTVLKQHPGMVLLSGYDNNLYNDMLCGWTKIQKSTVGNSGAKRVETLWMNYEIGQIRIF